MGLKGITINTPASEEAHILAEDDAAIYQAVFGGDCVFDIGSRMKATVLSNNKVRIGDGVICVGGHVARNIYGDYEELVIENGTSGVNRNDFIVAKFTSTGPGGVDTFSLEVKKGTAGSTASDPVATKGNLYEGASIREFPLYRVKIEGLSITAVEQLFTVRKTNEQLQNEAAELNDRLEAMGGLKRAYVKKSMAMAKGRNVLVSASELAGIGITNVSQIMSVHGRYGTEQFPIPALDVTNVVGDSTFRMSIVLDTSLRAVVAVCAAAWTSRNACVVIDYINM